MEQIVPDKYRSQIHFVLLVFSPFLLFLFSKIYCHLAQTGNTQLRPLQHSTTWKRPLFAAAGYGSLSCSTLPANRGSNTQALGRPSDNTDVSPAAARAGCPAGPPHNPAAPAASFSWSDERLGEEQVPVTRCHRAPAFQSRVSRESSRVTHDYANVKGPLWSS